MRIRFTKMHGLGNDFVVIDAIGQRVRIDAERAKKIADRRFGIGCDQVLVVEVPQNPDVDFRYRIFNNDGSEVENCGNGARCFAKFVTDRKLTGKSNITVETLGGIMTLSVDKSGDVTVDMGAPILTPEQIPFQPPAGAATAHTHTLPLPNSVETFDISAVSMGNPHAVTLVESVESAEVARIGPLLESHAAFPQKVNVGFMAIRSRDAIDLRVYERGAGETLACGTGACAAVVAGRLQNLLDESVTVTVKGGKLRIHWPGIGHPVMMTGPAATVFQGQCKL